SGGRRCDHRAVRLGSGGVSEVREDVGSPLHGAKKMPTCAVGKRSAEFELESTSDRRARIPTMSPTNQLMHRRNDGKRERSTDNRRDRSAPKDRRLPEPPTKIKPLGRKVGEAPGHLRSREEAFKRRHGNTKG